MAEEFHGFLEDFCVARTLNVCVGTNYQVCINDSLLPLQIKALSEQIPDFLYLFSVWLLLSISTKSCSWLLNISEGLESDRPPPSQTPIVKQSLYSLSLGKTAIGFTLHTLVTNL